MAIKAIHHIAIICKDYEVSKRFYTEVLGFSVLKETYRSPRDSFKLDLGLGENYVIELFSFPDTPPRLSRPEASGLRHLAFAVDNIESEIDALAKKGIQTEGVRIDEITGKKFAFFTDPDNLPLEYYEI